MQIEYTLTAEQDDIPVRGNAMASGDDEIDKKVEDEIIERLNQGDVWAWASVKVTCTIDGKYKGYDYLGACSYRDEDEFKVPDGYYQDMCDRALEDAKREREAFACSKCGHID